MNVAIFYHSASGNTQLCARRIARGLESRGASCEVINVVDILRDDRLDDATAKIATCDLAGFGSPVNAWKPTSVIVRFIEALPPQQKKLAFMFCTHAGQPANALLLLSRSLLARGFVPIATYAQAAEENWPIARAIARPPPYFGYPNQAELAALNEFSQTLFDSTQQRLAGADTPAVEIPFRRSWMHYLGQLVTPARLRTATGKKKADPARCTQCGLCARQCPTQAIRLDPYPAFDKNCVGCWACYNTCPEEAIDSSLLFGRNGRYHGPGDVER